MPATASGNATQRLRVLAARLSDEGLRALAVELGLAMSTELMSVPWDGNIRRGLSVMSPPRKTGKGSWVVGLGSLDILGKPDEEAPTGTISDFLKWYRAQAAIRKKKPSAKKPLPIGAVRKKHRRGLVEYMRTERKRTRVGLNAEERMRADVLEKEIMRHESDLERVMSAKAYERYMARWERIWLAEYKRQRRRRHGR